MDTKTANKLFRDNAAAMICIEIVDESGDLGVGTGFHVGEGVFLTARHVVEGKTISSIAGTEWLFLPPSEVFPDIPAERLEEWSSALGFEPLIRSPIEKVNVVDGPHFHPDARVDVAAFKADRVHPSLPAVKLGGHLDDWIKNEDWMLSGLVILGYPPVPLARSNYLLAVRAEINAVIDIVHSQGVHFIASAIPRGGFSGGLALSEFGFSLGIVTQSLVKNGAPAETGFFTITSVEPLYECLAYHKMLPDVQKDRWDGFWNTYSIDYVSKASGIGMIVASISHHDDGKTVYIDCHAHKNNSLVDEMARSAVCAMGDCSTVFDRKRDDWLRLLFTSHSPAVVLCSWTVFNSIKALLLDKSLHAVQRNQFKQPASFIGE